MNSPQKRVVFTSIVKMDDKGKKRGFAIKCLSILFALFMITSTFSVLSGDGIMNATVTTLSPWSVGTTSATLRMEFDMGELDEVEVYFEIYGLYVEGSFVIYGSGNTTHYFTVSNLDPNTIYSYKGVLEYWDDDASSYVPVYGEEVEFATYSSVAIDGPATLMAGVDGTFEADVTGTAVNYTWMVGGELIGYEATLDYNWTTIGPRTVSLTIVDDNGLEASATHNLDIRVEVTVTVVNEAEIPLADAYVALKADLGFDALKTTGADGTTTFEVRSVTGAVHVEIPSNMEFSVTGWHPDYDFNTEVFVGVTHTITLFEKGETPPAEEGVYVDHIRLEVRMDQSVGVFDTAAGELDAFLQAIEGPIYDGIPEDWKDELDLLESYGSYNEIMFNTATTHGYAEVDSNNDGTPDMFNPFAIREVRYATNWLISRQTVVEDIYDGFGIAQYSAIGQRNPAWAERLQPIIDEHGITYAGDFDIAYNMIQDAMSAAMDHDDLEGELRAPEGVRNFWQYRAPGGDWIDIETVGHIRIEDRRHEIGYMFSDLLEDCGIKVDRFDMDRTVMTWLFGEAADMEWGFYTGGWLASSAVLYQHAGLAQMYTHHYPFMPGDAYLMYFDPGARYAYSRDDPAAEELYELAAPLMAGEIPNMDVYWEYFEALMDRGVHESVRVFVQTSQDFIPVNKNSVTDVANDGVIGWSQFFSPRTIKTQDGNFRAAQFSAGQLYRDNWNNIGGFADTYSVTQARMTRDFATIIHPARGTSIPMRAEWTEIITDYDYDDDGVLEKNIPIPDDVVNYCVFDEEWTEGYGWNYDAEGNMVEHDYAASAVTYKWHFGTWHSGHDFDMQDLVAYFAFSKQLCWQTDAGGHYYVGAWAASQPYYNNILGIVFDEAEDTVTIYGDYTFPAEDQIAGYYTWMPEVPWQLYEAATQLIGMTDLAPATTLNDQPYSWSSAPGRNYVHWLSTTQGNDFDATLANIASEQWVPPYLLADRNSPIPLAPGDVGSDIGEIRAFFAEYEHHWITHGPFKLTVHDPANLIIEMERWTQADGYPWPEDHWESLLKSITMESPEEPGMLYAGESYDIKWTTVGDGRIDLEYSTDGGLTWSYIAQNILDRGTYEWIVPDEPTKSAIIRGTIKEDLHAESSTSNVFDIVGTPPSPPHYLEVDYNIILDHHQELYKDEVSEDIGYLTGQTQGSSEWSIRQHGSYIGDYSWDFGDDNYSKGGGQGHLSWLISPDIDFSFVDEKANVTLTFYHWRSFSELLDGGNLKISTNGVDGPWEIVHPEEGYDGNIVGGYGNPLGGEPGWGYESDWEMVTFVLNDYIGETIHLNWSAGTENWDGEYNHGWRIDNISIIAEYRDMIETKDHNQITWPASEDDNEGRNSVIYYNIYRSEYPDGPWDETTLIYTVAADGSEEYSYIDYNKGLADDIWWWYVVRAADIHDQDDGNTDAVQEPDPILPTFDISLVSGGETDGWNFVSFNIVMENDSISSILADVSDSYDRVMYYDAYAEQWMSYVPGRAEHYNNLHNWDHTMGVWIRMTEDTTLIVEGIKQSHTDITLYPGWNMVGYPSSVNSVAREVLPDEITNIGVFQKHAPYNVEYLSDLSLVVLAPGRGYWVYNSADYNVIWTVEY